MENKIIWCISGIEAGHFQKAGKGTGACIMKKLHTSTLSLFRLLSCSWETSCSKGCRIDDWEDMNKNEILDSRFGGKNLFSTAPAHEEIMQSKGWKISDAIIFWDSLRGASDVAISFMDVHCNRLPWWKSASDSLVPVYISWLYIDYTKLFPGGCCCLRSQQYLVLVVLSYLLSNVTDSTNLAWDKGL